MFEVIVAVGAGMPQAETVCALADRAEDLEWKKMRPLNYEIDNGYRLFSAIGATYLDLFCSPVDGFCYFLCLYPFCKVLVLETLITLAIVPGRTTGSRNMSHEVLFRAFFT